MIASVDVERSEWSPSFTAILKEVKLKSGSYTVSRWTSFFIRERDRLHNSEFLFLSEISEL
mgnify:CR=1 FL=1